MNRTVRNISIAVVVGIVTGMILGGFLPVLGIIISAGSATAGVGVVIGVTFALLNSRKDD